MILHSGLTPEQWPTTATDDIPCFKCDRPLLILNEQKMHRVAVNGAPIV